MKSPGKTSENMYGSQLGETTETKQSYESPTLQASPTRAQAQPIQNLKAQNTTTDSPYQYQSEYRNAQSLSSSPTRERLYEARQNETTQNNDYRQSDMRQSAVYERQQPIQTQLPREQGSPYESSPYSSSPQFVPSNTYGGFSSPKQPQAGMYSPENQRSTGDMSTYFKKPHNPLTNPLPVNVQNPYIAKEMNRIVAKQPYFANMASNNLIG